MENSKLTFRKWYRVMIVMASTKNGISAKKVQKQLGATRYESTWAFMHKIRNAMGQRKKTYTLTGQIELDEGYFNVETTEEVKKGRKRGRGSVSTVPLVL